VYRRLAAGELQHLGLALGRHERVEHPSDLCAREREVVGLAPSGVGEADRAVQVAAAVDLDDAQARVLLVLRADPAVQRTPVMDVGLEREWQRARLVEPLLGHVGLGIGGDQRLERAVLRAALAQHDAVVARVDLRIDHAFAPRADRARELQEHLVAVHSCGHRSSEKSVGTCSRL
jgi:hypothetical protein